MSGRGGEAAAGQERDVPVIAVVGFGDMGEQFVPHLLAAGHQVRVFDTDASRRALARRWGAIVFSTAAEAAHGAEVTLGLVMSDDIPAAYLAPDGLLAGTQDGSAVVIGSTTTRAYVEQVGAAAPRGVTVLDAPIVGGVKYARERAVTFLVGGSAAAFEQVRPVLELLGTPRHVGGFTAGVDYKLITNVAIMAAEAGLREALDLADILGRDYETSLALIANGPLQAVVERALDVSNPRPLRRSAQDDDTLLAAVDDPAAALPITTAASQRLWDAVNDAGFEPDFVDLTRRTTARRASNRSNATRPR